MTLLPAACFVRSGAARAADNTYIGLEGRCRQRESLGSNRETKRFTMKITIDIDCTPVEARAFFGLPDLTPLQAEMMKQMQERMTAALAGMDAEKLMKTW